MLKKLFIIALFCFLTIGFNHQINAAFTFKSTRLTAINYPYIQNERFAIRALRTIHSAEVTYSAVYGNGNYGSLDNLRQANFIDSTLASGDKYGYHFAIQTVAGTGNTPASLSITATPQHYRKTGRKSFYIDVSGVMRGADKNGAVATADDPIIENECLPNEECTISNMRWLYSAEATFQAGSNGGYGSLNQLFAEGLINELLARGYANGYNFAVTTIPQANNNPAAFKISAVPITYGVTGFRSFYIDESGVIRAADKHGEPATGDDPALE